MLNRLRSFFYISIKFDQKNNMQQMCTLETKSCENEAMKHKVSLRWQRSGKSPTGLV